jgi:hypothetical protein
VALSRVSMRSCLPTILTVERYQNGIPESTMTRTERCLNQSVTLLLSLRGLCVCDRDLSLRVRDSVG